MAFRGSTTQTCTPKPMYEPKVIISMRPSMSAGRVQLTRELDSADS